MATYNRAHFIAETLQSIQNQNFTNWECLIIDDGGNDNTLEVITPIINDDSRFSFHRRTTNYQKGLPGTRNYGLDLAKGEYIIFFDDDDIVHPDNLKIAVAVIKSNNADFCHYQKHSFQNIEPAIVNTQIIVEGNINKDAIKKVITQEIGLASCTVLWKKECFANIRFNESLMYAEEWECYIRIISENFKGVIISNVLYYNRKHSNSNTGTFYTNSPIRRESYTKAILLVTQNLKEKQLLTCALKRYFITLSLGFQEYNLFEKILKIMDLPTFEKIKWKLFYVTLPLRLYVYGIKKKGL
jgi:glycosyltransferase involved in cell wall biosynthesis